MLKYPNIRDELIDYVAILADPQLAYKTWVKQEFTPPTVYDSFTEAIGFFFDYTSIGIKEQAIGWMLYDEDEWAHIQILMSRMLAVFKKVGGGYAPDADYLEVAEWPLVAIAAQNVLRILTQNDTDKGRLSPDQV
jgi:hypothetical protein